MPLTNEQAKSIKSQLMQQAEKFPEDKRQQIKEYINSMNNEQLEEFLRQNQAMAEKQGEESNKEETSERTQGANKPSSQCVMCLISSKQIPSFAIYEDKDYLAALEINPLSEGHTILIPKKHIKEVKSLKSKAFTLANKIGKHLVKKLKENKVENFQVSTSDDLKHALINIIPTYKDKKMTGERKPENKQKLQELAIRIGELPKRKKIQKIKTDNFPSQAKSAESKSPSKTLPQFNRRIP